VESVHAGYRASSGRCVCLGVCVRLGSRLLLVSPPIAPDSSVAPPPGSPLPATPSWHALPVSRLWSTQVSASLPPSPAPPCLPCVKGRQCAAPHSSSFPRTTAPLQTLHMDMWGPAHVSGQGRERYFLLVVDNYSRYTTVFPLRSKGEVVDVLIPWIRIVRLQLRERFGTDLPVLRLHSDRGGEFSSDLLRNFCRGEGILQSFTLPALPQQNGIAECHIGLVMEVARTSMIHAAAPHFLWPFAVRYAAHQLNLWPRVSLPETSPTLRWTGKVGECVGVPTVGSGAARGAVSGVTASGGAEPGGAGSEGAGSRVAEPGGAEAEGVEPGGADSEGAESEGATPRGAALSGGLARVSPQLSSQQLREWLVRRTHCRSGAPRAGGARDTGAGGAAVPTGAGNNGAGDPTEPGAAGAGGAGVGGIGAGGAGVAGAKAVDPGAGGASSDLREHHEPASCPVSPVRTARHAPRSCPPPVPSTHAMALPPSSVKLHVPLPAPPDSSLLEIPDPASDRARAASPTVSRLLASVVTDPSFESAAASAFVVELLDFATACRLDYTTALVAESVSASPPSVGGECALGTDVLEDFECLAVAVPRFASMLLAPEGDPDAPDIATPRSYAEVITGTYVDEVPPSWTNIVDGMWIFMVKRPPGSSPAFKARYVARGFNQRQGVDYFQTFFPTSKMTILRVLLHVAAQRDYELHSLDFSTAFLQGSLHKEIWLCRPPGFPGTFPAGTRWSLRRPVYGLCQAPHDWHDTLRTTLAALGFAPSTADPSLFLRTDTSLTPLYVLVYVDDLVFATADTEALTLVKSKLQK
ncbi:unnamed protein product, partial [Closterium sp. NIES-53]